MTERMNFWRAMAYGPLPPIAIRDSDTLEAFDETSKWATSEEDDPLALSSAQSIRSTSENIPALGKILYRLFLHFLQSNI